MTQETIKIEVEIDPNPSEWNEVAITRDGTYWFGMSLAEAKALYWAFDSMSEVQ